MSQEPLTFQEKVHYTNLWCRSIGIKSRDLDTHKSIDDAILLIQFHRANWQDLDSRERGVWAALWSYVYHRECGLKQKHLNQLETICKSVIFKQTKAAQRRSTIQAMRARAQNKMGDVYGG